MMMGIRQREGETRQTWSVMVVAFLAIFSQIGVMVLPVTPKQIKLESYTRAPNEILEEEN